MQVYVIFPEKGGIHMGDNKKRRPPAFLRPLVHFTCFWRMSCLDCVNRDGPDCDCELLDKDGARIMACWWRWNGEWPTRRDRGKNEEGKNEDMKN